MRYRLNGDIYERNLKYKEPSYTLSIIAENKDSISYMYDMITRRQDINIDIENIGKIVMHIINEDKYYYIFTTYIDIFEKKNMSMYVSHDIELKDTFKDMLFNELNKITIDAEMRYCNSGHYKKLTKDEIININGYEFIISKLIF